MGYGHHSVLLFIIHVVDPRELLYSLLGHYFLTFLTLRSRLEKLMLVVDIGLLHPSVHYSELNRTYAGD